MVVTQQGIGADEKFPAGVQRGPAVLDDAVVILEADIFLLMDGAVDGIDGIIDFFVFKFDALVHKDLGIHLLRLINAQEGVELIHKLLRLLGGDKVSRQHGVNEQTDFG